MTELELLIDLHKDAERQGPGSSFETMRALNLMHVNKNEKLKIADIGCGSGAQTITLAQNIEGQITAVDLFPEFLDKLNLKSKELGFQEKIKTIENHPPFIHNLYRLAELSTLELTDEYADWLDTITLFNINARYNDFNREFYKQCTKEYTTLWIERIKEIREWIKQKL